MKKVKNGTAIDKRDGIYADVQWTEEGTGVEVNARVENGYVLA